MAFDKGNENMRKEQVLNYDPDKDTLDYTKDTMSVKEFIEKCLV